MNILIVEDDQMLLKATSHSLINAGHTVYLAENGSSAIETIETHQVDLVICDLLMPVLDGVTFLCLLKDYLHLSIPVIVTSSLNYADVILANNHVEFLIFMQKPYEISDLVYTVSQIETKQNT